jgi:hypothetical protein
MKYEGSQPWSQQPVTCPYPVSRRSILILSSHQILDLTSGLFSSPKSCMHLSFPPYRLQSDTIQKETNIGIIDVLVINVALNSFSFTS